MSTGTRPRETPHGFHRESEPLSLLEQVLKLPVSEKTKQMDGVLASRIDEIEALLPDFMKGQGQRLIKRARLTFADKPALQKCTPGSFLKCVLQAAELGFAIDGKLCHAVPYNTKKKGENGKEDYWVDEANCQVDYKGMLAVAKRLGVIQDGWARRVCEGDEFRWTEDDGVSHYHHAFDHTKPRGETVGVIAVATHKAGWYRAEWMDIVEIHAIRNRSQSYKAHVAKGFTSPWITDPGEMEKKVPLKRLLKTFADDPGLIRMLEIDNEDTDLDAVIAETDRQRGGSTVSRPRTLADVVKSLDVGAAAYVAETVQSDEETVSQPSLESTSDPSLNPQSEDPTAAVMFARCVAEMRACQVTGELTLIRDRYFGPDSTIEFSQEQDKQATVEMNQCLGALREKRAVAKKQKDLLVKSSDVPV